MRHLGPISFIHLESLPFAPSLLLPVASKKWIEKSSKHSRFLEVIMFMSRVGVINALYFSHNYVAIAHNQKKSKQTTIYTNPGFLSASASASASASPTALSENGLIEHCSRGL